jgi:hypothetical protein
MHGTMNIEVYKEITAKLKMKVYHIGKLELNIPMKKYHTSSITVQTPVQYVVKYNLYMVSPIQTVEQIWQLSTRGQVLIVYFTIKVYDSCLS